MNPKIRRYENVIMRLKKMLENEKKCLKYLKTLGAKEFERKNHLEKLLRQCVDDVKAEIYKKSSESDA